MLQKLSLWLFVFCGFPFLVAWVHIFLLAYFLQDLLSKAITNLAFFVWTHELVPLDILLLALIDRDDDPYALRLVVSPLKKNQV